MDKLARANRAFMKPRSLSNNVLAIIAVLLLTVAMASGAVGVKFGTRYEINAECCQIPLFRSLILTVREKLGLVKSYSKIRQDIWVSERVFRGVKNGFFVDVGAGDGTINSNTKALEQKGWTGICIDPFPDNMQNRTCQIFRNVVYSQSGKSVKFWDYGRWGGITDTLDPVVAGVMQDHPEFTEFTTVTLGDILERAKAPRFIHFMSMDIEGGELNALKGFPFDKYQIGALAVEHWYREPQRSEIKALMESHGYKRDHEWKVDDFYVPTSNR
jgi:FkbM family methyltransferase